MSKNYGQITNEIFTLLSGLETAEQAKILRAVSGLLDVAGVSQVDVVTGGEIGTMKSANDASVGRMSGDVKKVFTEKNPANKIIEFAIAARIAGDGQPITKEILRAVIQDKGKRRFDDANFGRDMDHAITAGFFNKGSARGEYALSHYGESYVDLLPNIEAAKELKKPKKVVRKAKNKKAA